MHARTYACKHVSMHARTHARTHACTHAHTHAGTHVRTHVITRACTHARTWKSTYIRARLLSCLLARSLARPLARSRPRQRAHRMHNASGKPPDESAWLNQLEYGCAPAATTLRTITPKTKLNARPRELEYGITMTTQAITHETIESITPEKVEYCRARATKMQAATPEIDKSTEQLNLNMFSPRRNTMKRARQKADPNEDPKYTPVGAPARSPQGQWKRQRQTRNQSEEPNQLEHGRTPKACTMQAATSEIK